MKILVVGGGGREHAIIWKIAQNKNVDHIYCAPGNGGISELAECVPINAMDIKGIVDFAKEKSIDLTVVAPDDPLAAGMVNELQKNGLRAFGPVKEAAVIEASKVFSKNLMKKYRIPTADYSVFDTPEDAIKYLKNCKYPSVIKADGLALGKGVIIAQNFDEAEKAVKTLMVDKVFKEAGSRILVEEFMKGPEVSVLTFTDGKTIVPMVSSQDHKRAFDNNKGPNTGGMGTISPSNHYSKEIADIVDEKILKPTVDAMNSEGRTFKGVLYFGLMLTSEGPKVLEYNARFGDPETQVVLPRLKTDLVDIMNAVIDGTLDKLNIEWYDDAAVCVVMASGGYPVSYKTGYKINGLDTLKDKKDIIVFHAGTKLQGDDFCTSGGRVLGVTAVGSDLNDAREKAYKAVNNINFENGFYRKDIGLY